jgi:hypothetical protein
MTEQQQRRGTDHPEGAWKWVKGPSWWREIPQVAKAAGVISMAFMAGITVWATVSKQFEIPSIVHRSSAQIDTLKGDVTSLRGAITNLQGIVPILESNYQRTLIESDKSERRWQYTWCLLASEPPSACVRILTPEDQAQLQRRRDH